MKKLMTAALVAACFASSAWAGTLPDEINMVYVKSPFNLQNMVIKEQGLLEKEFAKDNVKINWKTITSGAKQSQAMAAGSVDISAAMNTASLLGANGAGNPVLVANGVAHPADIFAIVGQKGEKITIKDLKGKKVAGPRGTVLHQLLVASLVKNGMTADDVEFLSMGIPEAMSAVTSGRVTAALLPASAMIKATEAGCQVITTAKDVVDVNLVMTVRKAFADEHPEALARVVKVQRESLKWINENWKEAVALGAKEHGISYEDADKLARWSNYYDVLTVKDVNGLAADQEFLLANGLMKKAVDVKSLVLPSAMK